FENDSFLKIVEIICRSRGLLHGGEEAAVEVEMRGFDPGRQIAPVWCDATVANDDDDGGDRAGQREAGQNERGRPTALTFEGEDAEADERGDEPEGGELEPESQSSLAAGDRFEMRFKKLVNHVVAPSGAGRRRAVRPASQVSNNNTASVASRNQRHS